MTCRIKHRRTAGFTLAEVMVALFIMSLLAMLGWRALDGMTRVQNHVFSHSDHTMALQSGLLQWVSDLDAVQESGLYSAIDFDGRLLRITRTAPNTGLNSMGHLQLVAWTLQPDGGVLSWQRWASSPLRTRGEFRHAWQAAALWGSKGQAQNVQVNPVDDQQREPMASTIVAASHWELFYFRSNAWTHPLSAAGSDASAETAAGESSTTLQAIPDGVRLRLTLAAGHGALQGLITRDWVRPTLDPRR